MLSAVGSRFAGIRLRWLLALWVTGAIVINMSTAVRLQHGQSWMEPTIEYPVAVLCVGGAAWWLAAAARRHIGSAKSLK